MASFYWFKVHNEILDDMKMHKMPGELFKRFIFLAAMASKEKVRDGRLPPVEDMAWCLRCDEPELIADLLQLANGYNMVHNDNGTWFVTNFTKRQEATSNADRQAQYRDRQRKDNEGVTARNTYIDIDIDIELEEDTEEDEIVDDIPMTNELGALEIAFTDATQLPGLSPSPQKAIDAYEKMHKAGVTAADVESAVTLLTDKEYTIIGPSSIVNTAISEKLKRTKPKKGTVPMTSEERSKKYSLPGGAQ